MACRLPHAEPCKEGAMPGDHGPATAQGGGGDGGAHQVRHRERHRVLEDLCEQTREGAGRGQPAASIRTALAGRGSRRACGACRHFLRREAPLSICRHGGERRNSRGRGVGERALLYHQAGTLHGLALHSGLRAQAANQLVCARLLAGPQLHQLAQVQQGVGESRMESAQALRHQRQGHLQEPRAPQQVRALQARHPWRGPSPRNRLFRPPGADGIQLPPAGLLLQVQQDLQGARHLKHLMPFQ
mmetsp:Transcript_40165/g.126388  ORF Transcript_40165/g.126388 Transcript_40165/m.126388 type:complete len:244 (-) Transcript_40165:892-1623(-)